MFELDEDLQELPAPSKPRGVGIGLVAVALIVPVLTGVVLCFVTSFGPALLISAAAVGLSSLLVAIDARRLENVAVKERTGDSALMLFLGMCLLWIAIFPYAFFRRARLSRPNLFVPSVLVALFFVGAPMLRALLVSVAPGLPTCTSPEVVKLVEGIVRGSTAGPHVKSIDGHHEISYDRAKDRRTGECVAHLDGKDIVVKYIIQWRERQKGLFEVVVPPTPTELPSCTSPEVVRLLETIVRKSRFGAGAKSIDGHREVSYDRAADRRSGQCVAHIDGGDIVIKYFVRWREGGKTHFEVFVPAHELPECTSPEVVQVLDQAIRGTPEGAKVTTIDGHREVSYDRAAERRTGQCVAHIGSENIIVKFIVHWSDRDKGEFLVELTR